SPSMSIFMKSEGNRNLSIFIKIFSTIPNGAFFVISSISTTVLVSLRLASFKCSNIDLGITLTLAPKSAIAYKLKLPIVQGRVKLYGFNSLDGSWHGKAPEVSP
ncbi:hypothetical protein Tco_0284637, partial [Tanacetum coccineum]